MDRNRRGRRLSLAARLPTPGARLLPRGLPRGAALALSLALSACATLGPEPNHPVLCPVTVRFQNQTSSLLRLSIDELQAGTVARPRGATTYTFSYPSASDFGCNHASVDVAARAVRPNGAPGWFVEMVSPDGGVFEYRLRAPIRLVPRRGVSRSVPFFGFRIVQTEYEAVATVRVDDMTTGYPVEVTELELLLRQTVRLEADLRESRSQIAGYQARVRELSERIVAEHAARVGAEQDLEAARGLLAELNAKNIQLEAKMRELSERIVAEHAARVSAEQDLEAARGLLAELNAKNIEVEAAVRRDLEAGRLSPATMAWALHTTADGIRANRTELCKHIAIGGGNLVLDVGTYLAKLSPLAWVAAKIVRWGIGRAAGGFIDDVVTGVCEQIT